MLIQRNSPPLLNEIGLAARAIRCRISGYSDYWRWTDTSNLSTSWDSRTKKIAELIPPNSRVLEFGSGRQVLKTYLDPSCAYYASDLVGNPSTTLICDLNQRPLPNFDGPRYDVAVFSGVLEYVRHLPEVVRWLSNHFGACVASYACSRSGPNSARRVIESLSRARYGWVNTYSEEELISLFDGGRFSCLETVEWQHQRIFHFVRDGAAQAPPPPAA